MPKPKFKTYTFDAPAHWAPALINGDTTGLEDSDLAEFESWCDKNKKFASEVVDCGEETHNARFNGVWTDMLTYNALQQK